jgi:predicted permease
LNQFTAIVTNPLILACLAGIGLAQIGVTLPIVVDRSLEIAGRAALPLALLAIGASLQVDGLRRRSLWLVAASAIKLLAFPLISLGLALALGLGRIELAVTVLVAAMPTAASAYPLTREMGGDADFVASAIALQTVLATLTVPLIVLLIGTTTGSLPG